MTEYEMAIIEHRTTVVTALDEVEFHHRPGATLEEARDLFSDCPDLTPSFVSLCFRLQYEELGRVTLGGRALGPTEVHHVERPVGPREYVNWAGTHRRLDSCLSIARRRRT
jgi:hypothetical protein